MRAARARRHAGAPAEPRRASTTRRGIVTAGLRHPAAARRHQPHRAASAVLLRRLFGGEAGIDPYTRAVSDVYQDLFGEGSFIGKGIYDVDAFERALGGRFPDNRDPQPRPARGLLRARRPASATCSCTRTIRRRYAADVEPPASLDPRRLAAAALAAAVGAAADGAARAQPAVAAVARQDARQPASQPGAAATAALLLLGWLRGADAAGVDAAACWRSWCVPPLLASLIELLRSPRDVPLVAHLRRVRRARSARNVARALC